MGAPKPAHAVDNGSFSQVELEGLFAPIALYPDGLPSQVLMASVLPAGSRCARPVLEGHGEFRGDALHEGLAKKNGIPACGHSEGPRG